MKLNHFLLLVFFVCSISNIFSQSSTSELEQARNAARARLEREDQNKRLLTAYDATEYRFLNRMIYLSFPTTPDAVYRFEQQWETISTGLVIVVGPNDIDIFGGTNENTYILQVSYQTLDDVRYNSITYRQLVIQDNLGLIKFSHSRRIPNANGPELIERNYKIDKRILIKCIGFTNVTLANGRLASRPLFITIPFDKDDPNNPERPR